jgi:hypothetical protein
VATTLVLVASATAAITAAPAQAAVSCDVTYSANQWTSGSNQGGFTASITLKNTGDPITSWNLAFDFPTTGQRYTPTGWSANWSQSGTRVTATNMPWNGNLGTGASTSIGFNGTWTGSNPSPTTFTVNGVTCGEEPDNVEPTVSLTAPTPGQSYTAPATVAIAANAADSDGSVAKVDFYQGSTLLGTDTSAPYNYSWQNVAAGSYSITARATDNEGAVTTSDPVGITVSPDSGPRLVVSPTTLSVPEGGSATFGVRLSRAPSSNVTVAIARASGDADITVGNASRRSRRPTGTPSRTSR